MARISKGEYELLKSLGDRWKWIARDSKGDDGGDLFAYLEKPIKNCDKEGWLYGRGGFRSVSNHLFQFVQWEDDEPCSISELIIEYEDESEETEVKKDIEWAKSQIDLRDTGTTDSEDPQFYVDVGLRLASAFLNQLDEPEVLSRELPVIPKFVVEWVEEMKQEERPLYSVMSSLMNKTNHEWAVWKSANKSFSEIVARAWLDGYEVEEEQKYVIDTDDLEISDGNHYLTQLSLSKGDMELPIVGYKDDAMRFENKEQAQAIADYVGGRVEELGE